MNMSMQVCCRDQKKMGQVINQIKLLADNLEELRAEINALRTSYLKCNKNFLHRNDFKRSRSSKTKVLYKLKKYMKKVTSIYSLKRTPKKGKKQEPYYNCTNLDPPLPSFLNYLIHTGKKEDAWQLLTRIKYLKNQGNQTNEKLENLQFHTKSSIASNIGAVDTYHHGSLFVKYGNHKQRDKIIFPRKSPTIAPKDSEISCELDLQIENLTFLPSSSDSYIFNNYPENVELFSNENNKRSATKSTQTKITKGRKHENLNFHSRHPNLYFSNIKNAVITKKVIKNSKKSSFTVCWEANNAKNCSHCKHCSCRRKRGSFTEANKHETNEQNFSLGKSVQILKNSHTSNKHAFQYIASEEEPNLSSSSVSLDLEVNISNNPSKTEEFRRKPRTYIICKKNQEYNQNNWLNRFERSVLYAKQTSSLSLHSFSDCNIRLN